MDGYTESDSVADRRMALLHRQLAHWTDTLHGNLRHYRAAGREVGPLMAQLSLIASVQNTLTPPASEVMADMPEVCTLTGPGYWRTGAETCPLCGHGRDSHVGQPRGCTGCLGTRDEWAGWQR